MCIVSAFNYSEFLNGYLELTFPPETKASIELTTLCVFVTIINWTIEKGIKTIKYQKWYGFIWYIMSFYAILLFDKCIILNLYEYF